MYYTPRRGKSHRPRTGGWSTHRLELAVQANKQAIKLNIVLN